jgi:hypothetical protein
MSSKIKTFLAVAGMFFAILTLTHVTFDDRDSPLPWQVNLIGLRLLIAFLLSGGLTTVLFHFKRSDK